MDFSDLQGLEQKVAQWIKEHPDCTGGEIAVDMHEAGKLAGVLQVCSVQKSINRLEQRDRLIRSVEQRKCKKSRHPAYTWTVAPGGESREAGHYVSAEESDF